MKYKCSSTHIRFYTYMYVCTHLILSSFSPQLASSSPPPPLLLHPPPLLSPPPPPLPPCSSKVGPRKKLQSAIKEYKELEEGGSSGSSINGSRGKESKTPEASREADYGRAPRGSTRQLQETCQQVYNDEKSMNR